MGFDHRVGHGRHAACHQRRHVLLASGALEGCPCSQSGRAWCGRD